MSTLTRLLGYLRPYIGQLTAAVLGLAISGALMAAVVSTVKPMVNEVLLQLEPEAHEALPPGANILESLRGWIPTEAISAWARDHAFVEVPLLIVMIFFVRAIFGYFGYYMILKSGASMIRDLRLELFESVTFQSLHFFQGTTTGTILARIINDVGHLQRVATMSMANGIRVAAMVPFLLIVAFVHDWRLSLVSLVALPPLGFLIMRLGRRLRRAATVSQENMADVAHTITETVGGVKVVQGFGMERWEIRRFGDALQRMLRADLKAGRTTSMLPAMLELLGATLGAGLFYFAGRGIAVGALDPGNFTVVIFCLGLLFVSIRRLNSVYADLQHAMAAAERVFDMLDSERQIQDTPGAGGLALFAQEICFEDVFFSYGDENVLSGIDLTLRRGEVVALVGASGSGKSTLANLLPRFYDPTGGRILFDQVDTRQATLASLREQIGIVTQETVLFDDTVRANLAYGRDSADPKKIVQVARAAQAHEFIENLPEGYDTRLGERGARLSMGQRQRLTIARALLKDPPLLILDEATSALDAESESLVQQALEVLMRGRTSLVIAHRLATVRRADRIVVLGAGRIIEIGTHDQLLERDGAYARLYDLQFRQQGGGITDVESA